MSNSILSDLNYCQYKRKSKIFVAYLRERSASTAILPTFASEHKKGGITFGATFRSYFLSLVKRHTFSDT